MNKRTARWGSFAILAAIALLANRGDLLDALREQSAGPADGDEARVLRAYERRESDLWLELEGTVEKTLADDDHGSRHQRWLLRLASGHTLLVAHNLDLAPRVPLRPGDTIRLRGEYEWNERGGVIHWTHADPERRKPGGWIRLRGKTYR